MTAELQAFIRMIDAIDDAEKLRRLLVAQKEEILELKARESERLRSDNAMSDLYRQLKAENEGLRGENERLKKQLSHVDGQNTLKKNVLFGRQTEQTAALLDQGDCEDPLAEDATPESQSCDPKVPVKRRTPRDRRRRKTAKRRKESGRLPRREVYEYDPEELDRLYGKGQWRIAFWHKSEKIEYIPRIVYILATYTPVLSIGLEHQMVCETPSGVLLPGSDATPSMVAAIMTDKYSLGLPLYRQEGEFARYGISLSRQTMDNWVIRFSHDLFIKVYGWMKGILKHSGCSQSDETTILVIRDGRKAGRKSYMWVHITSELAQDHPIAVFCYEQDRSTDHLRDFYADYTGQIICDAYSAYHTYECEKNGAVIICGCWMHARRRWAEALRLRITGTMTREEADELPEAKALRLISEIYRAEQPLKDLTVQERLNGRKADVSEKVNAYFAFIRTFDLNDPLLSERTKDAVTYSLNQEDYLRRFLEDGRVPIDNGETERRIRSFAIGRNNWMFCTSQKGAEANAILYTLVETAKLNGANVFYYLKYLLENAPSKAMPELSNRAMEDLMPWSEAYRSYEADQIQKLFAQGVPASMPKPDGKKPLRCTA